MRPLLVVAAALCVVSCNCGSKGPGEPGGGNLCGSEFSPVLASLCGVLDRCKDVSPYPIAYGSRAECTDILCWSLTCRYSDGKLTQTIPMNDAQKVADCSKWLDSAPCTLFDGNTMAASPCNGVLLVADDGNNSGTKQLGEDCSSGNCADTLYCPQSRYVPDAGLKTCRTCKPLSGEGQECGGGCLEPLFCEYRQDAGMAFCTQPHPDGAPCNGTASCSSGWCNYRTYQCSSLGKYGDACTAREDCRQGFCGTDGKCAPSVSNGGACTANPQCRYGFCDVPNGTCGSALDAGCSSSNDDSCASSNCDSSGHCAPALPNGTVCTDNGDCISRYCSSSRVCVSHCNSDSECDGGFCSFSSQQCEALRPDGQACQSDDECVTQRCNADDRCGAPKGPGSTCVTAADCRADTTCTNGTCVARPGPGQACSGLESCAPPYLCIKEKCTLINLSCRPARAGEMCAYLRVCDDQSYCDFSADITCKARQGPGGMCSTDQECVDGYCTSSLCAARKADGSACAAMNECKAGSACVGGMCKQSAVGTACDYDVPCPSGYWCGNRDTCLGDLDAGERCSSGTDSHCAYGLYCGGSYVCDRWLAPDAGCDGYRDGECGPTHYCNRDNSPYHCVTLPQAGEPCDSRAGCAAGAYCYGSMCEMAKDNGVSCSGDDQCKSRVCDYSVGCLAGSMCLP